MPQTQHTPGPWKVEYDNHGNGSFSEWYNVGPARVDIKRGEDNGAESDANARLIAAAPQLLKILQASTVIIGGIANGIVDLEADPDVEMMSFATQLNDLAADVFAAIKVATANGHA